MRPRSIQSLNAIGCCCPYPACPDPRQECESITFQRCAVEVPAHPSLPEGCFAYWKKDLTVDRAQSGYDNSDDQFDYTLAYSEINTVTCKTFVRQSDGACLLWPAEVRNLFSQTQGVYDKINERTHQSTNINYDCSQINPFGEFGDCEGDYYYSGQIWPDPEPDVISGPCSEHRPCFLLAGTTTCIDWNPGEDWTITLADDTIEFSIEVPYELVPATMPGRDISTVKYYLWDVSAMMAELGDLSFPGDANGIACSSYMFLDGVCDSPTAARKARYRFGVPEGYLEEGSPHVVYEMQWDEVFAPHEWWSWFDSGMVGPEPTPGPDLRAAREWIWDPEGSEWSPWHILEAPTTAGEIRAVNVLIVCWRSARLGTLPTEYGDQVAGLPDPPPPP